MRRIRIIMISIFLGGIFLGGIGTGIFFLEFADLSYNGQKLVGEENLITEQLEYSFKELDKPVIVSENRWMYGCDYSIEIDDAIPTGTIRYQVTYNPEQVEPMLDFYELTKAEEQGTLRFHVNFIGDDIKTFMEIKDCILADLKQDKIGSYQVAYVEDVQIMMNTEMKEKIIFENY